jgi:hypothetical protein
MVPSALEPGLGDAVGWLDSQRDRPAGSPEVSMSWRKWLIRSLVYTVLVGFVVLFVGFHVLTNPTATRRKVLDKLGGRFTGANISLESARLNLLDGISLNELRMARRDDLDKMDFLYVPSGIIYLDKEQVLDGKCALRKIVFKRPQLRVLIDRNGQCNLLGLLGPPNPQERLPTIVIQQGTIVLEDRRITAAKPILEIHDVNLTLLNDPLPQIVIDGSGQTDILGLLQVHAECGRDTRAPLTANLDLPAITVGPPLVQRLAELYPDIGTHLRQTRANGKMHARLSWRPGSPNPLALTINGDVSDGQFIHARLPYPIEEIEGSFECVNTSEVDEGERSYPAEEDNPPTWRSMPRTWYCQKQEGRGKTKNLNLCLLIPLPPGSLPLRCSGFASRTNCLFAS